MLAVAKKRTKITLFFKKIFLLVMPKYWGKHIFSQGVSPKWAKSRRHRKKKKKRKKKKSR